MFFNLFYPNYNFAHKYDTQPIINDEFTDHFHMIYEFLLMIRGAAVFYIENKRFRLNPGDLLIIPPGNHHHIDVDPCFPYERYVVKFPEYDIPKQILPAIKSKSGCFSTIGTPIPDLFARLDSHAEQYRGKDLCGVFRCVLREILYYTCDEATPTESEVYDESMLAVIDFINENIARKITLEDICDRFHYSKSYICKKFLQCMDVPLMQYIRTKKILLADSLIKGGAKPINIYEQCGFSDYSTFFRAYKKLLGKAPSKAR